MFTGIPTNTVVLIFAMMIAVGSSVWLSLSEGIKRTQLKPGVSRLLRWAIGILLLAWFFARVALSFFPPGGGVMATSYTVAFLGGGLLVGLLPLAFSPLYRKIVRNIPETWLVGLHATRVGAFIFLALMDMKLLPPEFALPAGYGDILAGLLALGVVYLLANKKPYARTLAVVWNILGLLDLVVAVTTGITFIGPFSSGVAASGHSLLYLNFVFNIPSFGVPLYAMTHFYSLYQLFAKRSMHVTQLSQEPIRTAEFTLIK